MRVLASAILSILCTSAFGDVPADPALATSQTLWRVYANEITGLAAGTGVQADGLQILGLAETISSEETPAGNYDRIENWCNPIPSMGPLYERSAQKVADIYGTYLRSLTYRDVPESERLKVEGLRKKYLGSVGEANKARAGAAQAWEKFANKEKSLPADRKTPYDVWYGSEWGLKVGSAEAAKSVNANAYAAALSSAYAGYQDVAGALIEYENDGNKVNAQDGAGKTIRLHQCSIGSKGDLARVISDGKILVGQNKYAASFTIATDRGRREESQWKVSARGGWMGFIGGRGSVERREVHEDTNKFKLLASFRNLVSLPIQREPWLKMNVVGLLNQDDNFVQGAAVNAQKLWSSDHGLWRFLPQRVLVAYQPSLEIQLDKTDYDYLFTKWDAGAGISIGNFYIGGKGSGSKETKTWDNATRTLKVEYPTDELYVLAVVSAYMPAGTLTSN